LYLDRRNIPSAVPAGPPDPYAEPKSLGFCALYGAIIASVFTIPPLIAIHSPYLAGGVIAAIWGPLLVSQVVGWYRYFFIIRRLQEKAAMLKEEADLARARLVELQATQAAENETRKAALAEYQLTFQEGKDAIDALRLRARTLADRKRVVRAMQDFGKAQSSASDEADVASRMKMQAEAMRRETRFIQTISFGF
jgi:hypothetical protein